MGKFLFWLLLLITIGGGSAYYYYTETGYKFGLEDTFLFKGAIGLTSPDILEGGFISPRFTCDGDDEIPRFNLDRIPEGAKSIAITMEDDTKEPKAQTHWILFNIDPDAKSIDGSEVYGDAVTGINDFGSAVYKGPCPDPGEPQRYTFKVYALNFKIATDKLNRISFDKVISAHVLASGTLVGVYSKKP